MNKNENDTADLNITAEYKWTHCYKSFWYNVDVKKHHINIETYTTQLPIRESQ